MTDIKGIVDTIGYVREIEYLREQVADRDDQIARLQTAIRGKEQMVTRLGSENADLETTVRTMAHMLAGTLDVPPLQG